VRSYLRSHTKNQSDEFLGLRVMEPGAPEDVPWTRLADWTDGNIVLSKQQTSGDVRVAMSKAQWRTRKGVKEGLPTVAGQLQVTMQSRGGRDSAMIVVRQDLPMQEHLNLAVRRLSALGRADIGGLLGFDAHAASLEDVTPECQRHRDGLDTKKGPHSTPGWKIRWQRIKEQRASKSVTGGSMNDNEAAAGFMEKMPMNGNDMMCVCSSREPRHFTEDDYTANLIGGEGQGVLAKFQTGRLAEATWD